MFDKISNEIQCLAINDPTMIKITEVILSLTKNLNYETIVYFNVFNENQKEDLFYRFCQKCVQVGIGCSRQNADILKINKNIFVIVEILSDKPLIAIKPDIIVIPEDLSTLSKPDRVDYITCIKKALLLYQSKIIWCKNFNSSQLTLDILFNSLLNSKINLVNKSTYDLNLDILDYIRINAAENREYNFWRILYNLGVIRKTDSNIKDDFSRSSEDIYLDLIKN